MVKTLWIVNLSSGPISKSPAGAGIFRVLLAAHSRRDELGWVWFLSRKNECPSLNLRPMVLSMPFRPGCCFCLVSLVIWLAMMRRAG